MEKLSQCKMIIKYIRDFGSITTLQAFKDLGCTRLASRITDLKNRGYRFRDKYVTSKNRYGVKVSYKKYYLEGDNGTVDKTVQKV